jgi:hypothetical protein
VVATASVAALVVIAVVVARWTTPAPPPEQPLAERGYLVYAAEDDGGPRLWVWNVSSGTATPGPRLRAMPSDLSFSFARNVGWVSATLPASHGSSRAVVLRSLDTSETPLPVGRGDLVAWLPSGGFVTLAETPPRTICRRHLAIDTATITTDLVSKTRYLDACGHPTMLGRDLTSPYVTMEHDGAASVYRVGSRRLVPLLRGYRALSVSLNGDLLVQRPGSSTLLYYYPSSDASPPARIARDGEPLRAERVLGWSGDADEVYVLGSIGDTRGVFAITVSPQVEQRSPTLVARTDARDVSASPTESHDVFVSADGEVTLVEGTGSAPLLRPPGAPPVTGPLLWIPTLPYSPAVAG